ncbi:MAG: sodium-independent anion transporter, partial [Vulcanibacillus sp.]
VLKKTGLYDLIGKDNFFDDTEQAINYAFKLIDQNKCNECKYYAFRECSQFCIENKNDTTEESKIII